MNVVKFEVGKPFPDNRYRAKQGAVVMLRESGFDVFMGLGGITKKEVRVFRKVKFIYGIMIENDVPFLMMDFPGLVGLDMSFNIKGFRKEIDRSRWLSSESNLVNLYFVDSNTFILKGLRSVGLNNE